MKGEDIYNGITEIREDLVEEAGSAVKKRRPMKKRALGAVAAVLAAALVAGYFLWPGSSPAVTEGYAICEAEYPEMAPYPDESALYTLDPNDEAAYEAAYAEFEAQYDAWWDDVYARRNLDNHAAGLADYLTSGAAQFLSGAEGKNRALSPVNVYMALAMLAELTDGESRAQLLELLGAEDIEALRETAGDVWNAAYRDDGAITSILASSVWLREDMDYKQEAMDALAKYYYASSYSGEMGSGEYDEAYRAWLNEQTGGLLRDAVAESGFDAETVLALASTVYFRSKWSDEFNPDKTESGVFHTPDGEAEAEFMRSSGSGYYYWTDKFSAAAQGLESGGAMWFILPDEGVGVDELLAEGSYMELALNPGEWEDSTYIIINRSIPKFDISSGIDLAGGLKALGVTDVFDAEASDFSPMSDMEGVYVSSASHNARVAIDEEGVTAAAFTELAMAGAGAPPEEEVDFIVDRPFIFVITTPNSLPLFVGVVNAP